MDIARDLAEALSDGKCPACGNYYCQIIFVDATVDLPTPSDTEMCEMCWELRAATPEEERPPIEVIEFRENTRQPESERKECERQRAIGEKRALEYE
jgi:hypothetical protein